MINHAIGASGVASKECKAVVEQYGQNILDLLMSQVLISFLIYLFHSQYYEIFELKTVCVLCAKVRPKKICSQVGLCAFDGTRSVRSAMKSPPYG